MDNFTNITPLPCDMHLTWVDVMIELHSTKVFKDLRIQHHPYQALPHTLLPFSFKPDTSSLNPLASSFKTLASSFNACTSRLSTAISSFS